MEEKAPNYALDNSEAPQPCVAITLNKEKLRNILDDINALENFDSLKNTVHNLAKMEVILQKTI